jgi:hypothetical protein
MDVLPVHPCYLSFEVIRRTFGLNAAEVTTLALTPEIIWPGLYVMALQPNALPPAEENAAGTS